ncbi:MAG: undecaprenyldiphospho-muramoylpentapeptide beta-N-acetylglucosaminyltransferase [Verrucomicrobiales bacterium]|nr:undecaprenyldiphospho-muramoylpentapeptide beta-N-acetylglucosaminyltransferase [Verrucomicrobiales bacterium]
MTPPLPSTRRVAIACGGTGGHLFPGLAVAEQLFEREAEVRLLVSAKDVDQRALQHERRFEVMTLPAVGFSLARALPFALETLRSLRLARAAFQQWRPDVFLSMGGFTSAPPALAARSLGIPVALHEANAIPGRANRWLARFAQRRYLHFPESAHRLPGGACDVVGMPVRSAFQPSDPGSCRLALGLDPRRPVLLVMGGSQGARALNRGILDAAPALIRHVPGLQFLHVTGREDEAETRAAYARAGINASVRAFLTEMELALGAADATLSRAGASSIAECAALRVPALLVPYPHAADDHQAANARALESVGAACVLAQSRLSPESLVERLVPLLADAPTRARMQHALATWHRADADARVADGVLRLARGQADDAGSTATARRDTAPSSFSA